MVGMTVVTKVEMMVESTAEKRAAMMVGMMVA